MVACRDDEYQGSNLVARRGGLGDKLHEIHAGNKRICIHDQGFNHCVGRMIGSLVLLTTPVPVGHGRPPKLSTVQAIQHAVNVMLSPLDQKRLSTCSSIEKVPLGACLEEFVVALGLRGSPQAVSQEALGSSLHVKFVGIMRVCGSATVVYRKLSLSYAGRKLILNITSVELGGLFRVTARSTHEENATLTPGAFSIRKTFFPHCIALHCIASQCVSSNAAY